MAPEWSDWLGALGREGKMLPEAAVPLAMRGFEWRMRVALDGDFRGYQLVGRVAFAPDTSPSLAVMEGFGPVFESGQTFWEMSLATNVTSALPPDNDGDAVRAFPFLLVLVPPAPAVPYPLAAGLLTVVGAI